MASSVPGSVQGGAADSIRCSRPRGCFRHTAAGDDLRNVAHAAMPLARRRMLLPSLMGLTILPLLLFAQAVRAQDAAAFYEGRTLNLVAGFNVGGGADTYARLIA